MSAHGKPETGPLCTSLHLKDIGQTYAGVPVSSYRALILERNGCHVTSLGEKRCNHLFPNTSCSLEFHRRIFSMKHPH